MKPNIIVIKKNDNVAVCLEDIQKGGTIFPPGGADFISFSDIPYSHKVALCDISEGESILKYGEIIGHASTPIRKGEWVHTHNLIIQE